MSMNKDLWESNGVMDMLGVVAIISLCHGGSASFLEKVEMFGSLGWVDNSTCFSAESLEVWCLVNMASGFWCTVLDPEIYETGDLLGRLCSWSFSIGSSCYIGYLFSNMKSLIHCWCLILMVNVRLLNRPCHCIQISL
jgi:hypothetical protein